MHVDLTHYKPSRPPKAVTLAFGMDIVIADGRTVGRVPSAAARGGAAHRHAAQGAAGHRRGVVNLTTLRRGGEKRAVIHLACSYPDCDKHAHGVLRQARRGGLFCGVGGDRLQRGLGARPGEMPRAPQGAVRVSFDAWPLKSGLVEGP